MTAFVDEYLPKKIWGFGSTAVPKFSTTIARSDSGDEQRNRNRMHPLHSFHLPEAIRDWDVMEDVIAHWMVMSGPYKSFPIRNPLDFASVSLTKPNVEPTISGSDQAIGTGDGATTQFQLVKTYTRGASTYVRPIKLPVVSSVIVFLDGNPPGSSWSVTRKGGVVTFDTAPTAGQAVTAGFYFDVPVRFESDESIETIAKHFQIGGVAPLSLMEVPLC